MDEIAVKAVVQAVVDTLRQLAGWSDEDRSVDELLGLAALVEGEGATGIMHDGWSCPMCQEVECDEDCPLAAVRSI